MIQTVLHGKPRTAQAEKLVDRWATMKPGDTIRHDEIAALIGEKYRTNAYIGVVQKASKMMLRKHGVKMQALIGVGYEYPTGGVQMNRAVLRGRAKIRQFARTVQEVAAVTDDRLLNGERERRDFYLQRAKLLSEYAQQESKVLTVQFSRTPVLPK